MASFYLTPLEGGYEVPVEEGKISVGRGPFLRIIDKRVSRHHAIIEVSGSTMRVLPIHTNPTFYKGSGETKFEALEKDKPKELQNGDSIAFLSNNLIFKVLSKDKSSFVIEKDEEIKSTHVIDSEEVENNELHGGNVCEEQKELVVIPLNKTRNLPSWMTNSKDKTACKTSKKGCQSKSNKDNTCTVTSEMVTSVDEGNDKEDCDVDQVEDDISDKLTKNSGVEEEAEQQVPESTIITEQDHKKRKREDSEETVDSGTEQAVKREKNVTPCPYGNQCYRKNPIHFQEYSHDGEQSVQSQNEDQSEDENERPECPYGTSCYRQNPSHQKEYKHIAALPKTRERKAKTKAGSRSVADDDDTAEDSDYDDSFINDSEGSSCKPSEHDDSDWVLSDDDEDVGELLAEARGFTKNKKMLKP